MGGLGWVLPGLSGGGICVKGGVCVCVCVCKIWQGTMTETIVYVYVCEGG